MKKLVALTAVALALGISGAIADDHMGGKDHGPRGEKMFEKLDADGNGSVSKDEFMKAQEEHFAKMDADGDGSFTKEEAKVMREKMDEKRKAHREEKKAGETPAVDAPVAPAEEKPAE